MGGSRSQDSRLVRRSLSTDMSRSASLILESRSTMSSSGAQEGCRTVPNALPNSYQVKVPIFKQFHKFVIGKGGANIRRIRDETDTRIDLPDSGSESDMTTITGKKENVSKVVRPSSINFLMITFVSLKKVVTEKFMKNSMKSNETDVNALAG